MKKKIIKISVISLLIIVILLQFVPTKKNISEQENDENSFLKIYNPPDEIAKMLKNACYDCHSNNTRYPWYSNIQPVALLMQNHIFEGKEELNFSEFGKYSKRKQKNKIKSIIKQIKNDKMPLKSYLLMHQEARLSQEQKDKLISWLNSLIK